ncbi:hypothetical protein ACHAWO_011740 [Cyclotella atomus]|uniref:Uncharacterized protein n=1 Tax=Cyclotella atomus TaxID=382360 RepID=A0ABD3MPV2_9STRA
MSTGIVWEWIVRVFQVRRPLARNKFMYIVGQGGRLKTEEPDNNLKFELLKKDGNPLLIVPGHFSSPISTISCKGCLPTRSMNQCCKFFWTQAVKPGKVLSIAQNRILVKCFRDLRQPSLFENLLVVGRYQAGLIFAVSQLASIRAEDGKTRPRVLNNSGIRPFVTVSIALLPPMEM